MSLCLVPTLLGFPTGTSAIVSLTLGVAGTDRFLFGKVEVPQALATTSPSSVVILPRTLDSTGYLQCQRINQNKFGLLGCYFQIFKKIIFWIC
jgi:hypothetical protein